MSFLFVFFVFSTFLRLCRVEMHTIREKESRCLVWCESVGFLKIKKEKKKRTLRKSAVGVDVGGSTRGRVHEDFEVDVGEHSKIGIYLDVFAGHSTNAGRHIFPGKLCGMGALLTRNTKQRLLPPFPFFPHKESQKAVSRPPFLRVSS